MDRFVHVNGKKVGDIVDAADFDIVAFEEARELLIQEHESTEEDGMTGGTISKILCELCEKYPESSPTDLWAHGLKHNYLDIVELSEPIQGWRGSGSSGFKKFFIDQYNPLLGEDVRLVDLPSQASRRGVVEDQLDIQGDDFRADVLIEGQYNGNWYILGVCVVMTMLRERLEGCADDEGHILLEQGLLRPVITLDANCGEGLTPVGELTDSPRDTARRSCIEKEGSYTNLYSFNHRTNTTTGDSESGFRIEHLQMSENDDPFVRDLTRFKNRFFRPLQAYQRLERSEEG